MKRIIVGCIVLIGIGFSAKAQSAKSIENSNQLWFGYYCQLRLTNKWEISADFQLRTREEFVNNFSQSVVRIGLTYYVSDETKLTAGYAYSSIYTGAANKKMPRPENRPWQQIQWRTIYGKKSMVQRIRLEERFRRKILNDSIPADGNSFNFRIRYNILYEVPFSKKGDTHNGLSFVINDEVHINFGKQIINNYFDQNRFFLGLKYQVTRQNNLQVGYMNLFQQLATGNKYRSIHAIRLFYFQNLDLRQKCTSKKMNK